MNKYLKWTLIGAGTVVTAVVLVKVGVLLLGAGATAAVISTATSAST